MQQFRNNRQDSPLGGVEEMADDMDYLDGIQLLFGAEQDTMADKAVEANMEDYLEDIRFLFEAEDTTAVQDEMADEAIEADMEDYLEDIRFLFEAEDTTAVQDEASLGEDETAAADAKRVKWVKDVTQKLKKMKKGMRKFCSRLVKTVRRSFCCCVSVEE